jgi:hypothetical protein
MTMIDVWVELDGSRAGQALHEATEKLDSAGGDVFLDFSRCGGSIQGGCGRWRISRAADDKAVMVTLRGINVDIHKVLKLATLSSRFSMVN